MKRYLAMTLPLALATGIIILTLRGVFSPEHHWPAGSAGLYVAMTGIYLLWMLAETRTARRDSKEREHATDSGTREFYG